MIDLIRKQLSDYRFDYSTEAKMQEQVYSLLLPIVDCRREVILSPRDRIDLLTDCGIGIECKVKGSAPVIVGQLLRYAEHDAVKALILVTSKRLHLTSELFREQAVLGKPLFGLWVGANW